MSDRTKESTTPKIIGTEVLRTICIGDSFVVPATIKITAATGDTALSRFPESCIGIDKATGSIPAALESGIINGIIANNKAVPLPLSKTMTARPP